MGFRYKGLGLLGFRGLRSIGAAIIRSFGVFRNEECVTSILDVGKRLAGSKCLPRPSTGALKDPTVDDTNPTLLVIRNIPYFP